MARLRPSGAEWDAIVEQAHDTEGKSSGTLMHTNGRKERPDEKRKKTPETLWERREPEHEPEHEDMLFSEDINARYLPLHSSSFCFGFCPVNAINFSILDHGSLSLLGHRSPSAKPLKAASCRR